MKRIFLALAFLLVAAPLSASAQLLPGGTGLTIRLSPEYPRPYETVTATVESTLANLPTSEITISVDGAVIESGQRSGSFKAGAPGKRMTVRATAVSSEGSYSTEKSFTPAEVALVVEATSTAHPFYEGALLVPSEGKLRLVALADIRTSSGARVANENIAYTWRLGDKILLSDSGLGRNVLTASAPPRYRDAKVSVTAETRDRTVVAYASTAITPVDPVMRLYRNDPLRGTDFATALSGAVIALGAEETFRAIPYFFSSMPPISWRLNGSESGSARDLTIRSSGNGGTAVLSAGAADKETSAAESFMLQFGESRPAGLFGF